MWPWLSSNFVDANARWIWNMDAAALPNGAPVGTLVKFTKSYFSAATAPIDVTIHIVVDNQAEVLLNSVSLGKAEGGWGDYVPTQLPGRIKPGDNVLEVRATNWDVGSRAGLLVAVTPARRGATVLFHTDESWTWQ